MKNHQIAASTVKIIANPVVTSQQRHPVPFLETMNLCSSGSLLMAAANIASGLLSLGPCRTANSDIDTGRPGCTTGAAYLLARTNGGGAA